MSTYYCESCLTGENKYIDGGDLSIPLPGIPNVGFDIGSGANNQINSVKLQSDGKILVGGSFTSYSGVAKNYIVRLNTDGSVDTSFVIGTGFNANVNAPVVLFLIVYVFSIPLATKTVALAARVPVNSITAFLASDIVASVITKVVLMEVSAID
jgi:hypothetical protein